MFLRVFRYRLADTDDGDYLALCERLAPRFADVPGLLASVWLRDPDSGYYGGAYLWWDQAASRRFAESDLLAEVVDPSRVTAIEIDDFDVLDGPTRVTLGLLARPEPAAASGTPGVGNTRH